MRVPVLSVNSDVDVAEVLDADEPLDEDLAAASRREPAARLVDTIAGSSCGVMPTAMASENSSASMSGRCSSEVDDEDRRRQRAGDVDQQHREVAQARPGTPSRARACPGRRRSDRTRCAGRSRRRRRGPTAGVHDRAHERAARSARPAASRRRPVAIALVDGQRLAGEHRLVASSPTTVEQPQVGGHQVAEPQLDDVAGYERGHVERRARRRARTVAGGGSGRAAPRPPARRGTR